MSAVVAPVRFSETEGMVGKLPWCRPLSEWPIEYIERALGRDEDELTILDDSPVLARAMRREHRRAMTEKRSVRR